MAVADRVKSIIVEQLGVDEDEVTLEASFTDDLGADSLDIVELVMAFEEEFAIESPYEEAAKIGGEVKDFNPQDYVEKTDVKKSDAFILFALAATKFAVADSGLTIDRQSSDRVGVVIGSGIGGLPLIETTHSILLEKGPGRVS